jgi:hypothetical protein
MKHLPGHRAAKAVIHGAVLAVSCQASYWLVTRVLAQIHPVSKSDDLLGGMWAVIATVFVYHDSYKRSVSAALSRMAATLVSFALCLAYLLIFPFHAWGMAVLIGIGAIIVTLIGKPEASVTTGITTAVVMVVAGLDPRDAWVQPILRLFDTLLGAAVGLAAVRLTQVGARSAYGRGSGGISGLGG